MSQLSEINQGSELNDSRLSVQDLMKAKKVAEKSKKVLQIEEEVLDMLE